MENSIPPWRVLDVLSDLMCGVQGIISSDDSMASLAARLCFTMPLFFMLAPL